MPTTAARCAITGPDAYGRNDPEPPSFQIWSSENRYFAVEVTSDAALFDEPNNGAKRTVDNFYASWQTGLIQIPASGNTIYHLSSNVWRSMRQAEAIYYRLLTSAAKTRWTNTQSSLTKVELGRAPTITLKGRFTHMPTNPYPPEEDLWRRPADL